MPNASDIPAQELSQRFAQMVMMQAQNILYLLGRLPGAPGESIPLQLPEAKMLIDQLEMLQAKTAGNLTAQEQKLLDNSVTQMRLAFVEASGGTTPGMMPNSYGHDYFPPEEEEFSAVPPAPVATGEPAPQAAPAPADAPKPEPAEDKKKFFKSYG